MVAIPPGRRGQKGIDDNRTDQLPIPHGTQEEPGLNPNHPNQRMNAPTEAKGKLCPGIVLEVPSFEYFPILGPKTMAAAKAENPPIA